MFHECMEPIKAKLLKYKSFENFYFYGIAPPPPS